MSLFCKVETGFRQRINKLIYILFSTYICLAKGHIDFGEFVDLTHKVGFKNSSILPYPAVSLSKSKVVALILTKTNQLLFHLTYLHNGEICAY